MTVQFPANAPDGDASEDFISKVCIDRGLYETPSLNTKLLLHGFCLKRISGLRPYYNVRCLYLSENAITDISDLGSLTNLRSIYLQNNKIARIDGLQRNLELRVIDLSHNEVERIDGISHLQKLSSLNLSHNRLSLLDDGQGDNLFKCKSLTSLDLSYNDIREFSISVANGPCDPVDYFAKYTPTLRCLYTQGNSSLRSSKPQMTDRLISAIPSLVFVDERPVSHLMRKSIADLSETAKENHLDPNRVEGITKRREMALARIARENDASGNVRGGPQLQQMDNEAEESQLRNYRERILNEYRQRNVNYPPSVSSTDDRSGDASASSDTSQLERSTTRTQVHACPS